MVDHWLKPLSNELLFSSGNARNRIVDDVKMSVDDILPGRTIVLLGADEKWTNRVRHHLYNFASNFAQTTICDLGNFRKVNAEFIAPAITELINTGALPVVIGCREDMGAAVLQALRTKEPDTQGVFVQEAFSEALNSEYNLAQTSYIGIQQHLVSEHVLKELDSSNVSWTRLSTARNALDESEPVIRDAGLLFFDMSALRYADFSAQKSYSTSGFFTEEACQIMRYGGTSPHMRCICLSGHDPMSMSHSQSANTQAQLLWYLFSGFDQRVVEIPDTNDRFTQYLVHLQQYDFDLSFFKSNNSGRWWLKLPGENSQKMFSCAYGDYLAACEDVVSDRVSRLVEMSLDVAEK
jgi:formiminoglutamase